MPTLTGDPPRGAPHPAASHRRSKICTEWISDPYVPDTKMQMNCCLELGLSAQLAEQTRALLGLADVPTLHLTLFVFTCNDINPLVSCLEGSRRNIPKLAFSHVGFFGMPDPVAFLAPVVTQDLLAYHSNMFTAIRPALTELEPLTRPDSWVPHITLPCDVMKMPTDRFLTLASALASSSLDATALDLRDSSNGALLRRW